MPQPKRVFLSYVHEDRDFILKITPILIDNNITPVLVNLKIATRSNPFDMHILQQVLTGVKNAIVVFSKSFFKSEWHIGEFGALMSSQMNGKGDYVIPIIVDDCDLPEYVKLENCIDFRKSFEDGTRVLTTRLTGNKKAFVIMRLGNKDLDLVYQGAIKLIAEKYDYTVTRIDEIQNSELLTPQILQEIDRSDLIIADLTDNRPNCYYEVGYAKGIGTEVILTVNESSTLHFDLAGNRFIVWTDVHQLREKLERRLKSIKGDL